MILILILKMDLIQQLKGGVNDLNITENKFSTSLLRRWFDWLKSFQHNDDQTQDISNIAAKKLFYCLSLKYFQLHVFK